MAGRNEPSGSHARDTPPWTNCKGAAFAFRATEPRFFGMTRRHTRSGVVRPAGFAPQSFAG